MEMSYFRIRQFAPKILGKKMILQVLFEETNRKQFYSAAWNAILEI